MIGKLWSSLKRLVFVSGSVKIGARFHIGVLSFVSSARGLTIGNDVYIGKFCSIQVNGRIGDGVLIANNVGLVGRRDHDAKKIGVAIRMAPWVGDDPVLSADIRNSIDVGSDVWIGFAATVLSGIKIGNGAIIAAGSVVVADVAPYDIVAGNPARKIGRRFTDIEIREHEVGLARSRAVP